MSHRDTRARVSRASLVARTYSPRFAWIVAAGTWAAAAALGLVASTAGASSALPPTVPSPGAGSTELADVNFLDNPPSRIACGPITVTYDPMGAPPNLDPIGLDHAVNAAVSRWGAALDRPVALGRPGQAIDGTVVSISWTDHLGPAVAGRGGGTTLYEGIASSPVTTGGTVTLAADQDMTADEAGSPGSWGEVVEHELGHVAGLDHAYAPGSRMSTPAGTSHAYTPAEQDALARAGQANACDATSTPTQPTPRSNG